MPKYTHVCHFPMGGKALCYIDSQTPPGLVWALGGDQQAHLARADDNCVFVRTELDIFHPSVSELEVEYCTSCVMKMADQ